MTDTFLHPDGHHYRFLGFGPATDNEGRYIELNDGAMVAIRLGTLDSNTYAIFERVDPPLWPWTAPSGIKYDYPCGVMFTTPPRDQVPEEDFAGLSERLGKQAAINAGDA